MTLTAIKYGETTLPESWVFSGGDPEKKLPIALLYFLIRANGRNILIDAGCDDMPGFETPLFMESYLALKFAGLEPEEITDIIVTHAHHDHIDGVRHFPNADIYIQREEAELGKGYLPQDGRVKVFDDRCSFDISPDKLAVKKIGGHSPGSSVVMLRHGWQDYILVGDEFYSKRCITENRGAGAPFNRENNLALLEAIRRENYIPIVFHDPSLVNLGVFGATKLIRDV